MDRDVLESEILEISRSCAGIRKKLEEFVVGNQLLVDSVLIAMLSEGHILIEGSPGTAKTTIAKAISLITGCEFKRIQGAIDIQPADMIGVRVYDPGQHEFVLRQGPIFTNLLLVDEINRINPKSQSAFIEAMSERQATIDGITISLSTPFFVIATQNPYEFEGTFPLIEAQRDRFMISVGSAHLNPEDELSIIQRANSGNLDWDTFSRTISPLLSPQIIEHYINVVREVTIEEPVLLYIRNLVVATRSHPDISLGASSRASLALVTGGKSLAAINGRSYVLPDDIKKITQSVLGHRLLLTRDAEVEGLTPETIITEILNSTEVL
jgi:MoxR-like ATPase